MSVAASWSLAFGALGRIDPSGLQLLVLLGWLAPEPVPLTLLSKQAGLLPEPLAATVADPLALATTLHLITVRALARIDGDTLLLHRIPATLLRNAASNTAPETPQPIRGWAASALLLLHRSTTDPTRNNPATWPVWQRLLPHVLATTTSERTDRLTRHHGQLADLLVRASDYLTARGQVRQALPLSLRAIELLRHQHEPDHPDVLRSADNLAMARRAVGEYQQAKELDEEVLEHRLQLHGPDHPDTLRSANNLAIDLRMMHDHQRARELNENTRDRRLHVLGPDHPDTLLSANNLAVNLRATGEFEQARKLDEDTFDRYRRVLGSDHPDTRRSADNLALNFDATSED